MHVAKSVRAHSIFNTHICLDSQNASIQPPRSQERQVRQTAFLAHRRQQATAQREAPRNHRLQRRDSHSLRARLLRVRIRAVRQQLQLSRLRPLATPEQRRCCWRLRNNGITKQQHRRKGARARVWTGAKGFSKWARAQGIEGDRGRGRMGLARGRGRKGAKGREAKGEKAIERARERGKSTREGRQTTVLPRKHFGRSSLQDWPAVLSLLCFVTNFDVAQTETRRGHRKVGL
eukprot:4446447-Pleurochrysis_carterae.AAC.1